MSETFVATEPLYIGRARAHNTGDEVPADNVQANGWADKVARVGTKAAEKASTAAQTEPAVSTPPS